MINIKIISKGKTELDEPDYEAKFEGAFVLFIENDEEIFTLRRPGKITESGDFYDGDTLIIRGS